MSKHNDYPTDIISAIEWFTDADHAWGEAQQKCDSDISQDELLLMKEGADWQAARSGAMVRSEEKRLEVDELRAERNRRLTWLNYRQVLDAGTQSEAITALRARGLVVD